ncbi:MAG TPA: hypothetical protein VEP30_04325 [Chthoniobacterales bacterium]|nr:hypothetical protein [Chthoniobacterales bacterium]
MKRKSISMSLFVGLVYATLAAAPDNRFDGIWVGTETVMGQEFHGTLKGDKSPRSTSAKIVIAQGGSLLGVLEGYGTGRYNDVKRVGNTIVFHAGNRTGQLSLSPDGQTLVEKGSVPGFIIIGADSREGALSGHQTRFQSHDIPALAKSNAEVTGTFHRAK